MLRSSTSRYESGGGRSTKKSDDAATSVAKAATMLSRLIRHEEITTARKVITTPRQHPAWSWMYAVDPANVPALAILPLVVGHAVVEIGAFYAGAMLVRAERRRVLLWAIAALGVVALIAVLVWRGRLGLDTSYAGYHAGRGRELMEVELGWALMVSMMASAGSIIYVMIELARDGRRVRAR